MKTRSILSVIFATILISLLTISCDSGQGNEISKWQERADGITIIRDNYGVPHIYGETYADAVFGMVYAQCEDYFNRV